MKTNSSGNRTRLTVSETTAIAQSIHGSLVLEEILHKCRGLLSSHFPLGRFTFMQHRASETTATIYSLDGQDSAPARPRVIDLAPSRTQQCLVEQKAIFAGFTAPSEQDALERSYLLQPETSAAIYLPLILNGKLVGIIVLDLGGVHGLTSFQRSYLKCLTTHVALAIENSDRNYMEQRRTRQLALISEIAKQAVRLEDLDEFLRAAAEMVRKGFDYNVVQIWTLNQRQELILRAHAAKADLDQISVNSILPLVQECCTLNQSYCDNHIERNGGKAAHQGTASQLVVPIRLRGKFLGVLSLESGLLEAFSGQDFDIMDGVASIIASAFDNLMTLLHAQQSNQYMQAILESAKDRAILSTDVHGYVLTSSAGVEQVFRITPQEVLGRDILSLFANPGFQGELALYINSSERPTLERAMLSQSNGSSNAFLDVNLQRVYDSEKRPIGLLCIVRDVTEHVQMQHSLEALSVTDDLTGIYNQRRFFSALADEIERSRRFNRSFSLCFFDLDRFKQFNDTQGHLRGDQALKETAILIRTLVRAGVDTCYRYGGDEFTIIMPETTKEKGYLIVERIRNGLSRHFAGEITASVGVAEYYSSCSVEELVDKADRAMYTSKIAGGNRVILAD